MSWSSLTSTDAGCASCGELGGSAVKGLFANAAALLMPVRWREPFGMVMVGALACGTPVIGAPRLDRPAALRASVAERYDISVALAGYERVYRRAIAADCPRHPRDRVKWRPTPECPAQCELMAKRRRDEHRPSPAAQRGGS